MGDRDSSGTSPQDVYVNESFAAGAQDIEEINRIVDGMTLFDDDLMSKVFDRNIEATELLLRIILQRSDIHVTEVIGQYDMQSPFVNGREIRLDIKASDSKGNEFDVEVQRDRRGSHNRRARFHTAMVDVRMLKEGQDFKDIKDSYVIFICQHDKFNAGKPVYHIDKLVRETGKRYLDGSNVIFVNGKYKGNDQIGKLMHDFSCLNSKDMYYKPLADGVRHFKETEKGRENMCDAVKEYAKKESVRSRSADVKALMESMKLSLDQALNALKIEGDERAAIAKQLKQ